MDLRSSSWTCISCCNLDTDFAGNFKMDTLRIDSTHVLLLAQGGVRQHQLSCNGVYMGCVCGSGESLCSLETAAAACYCTIQTPRQDSIATSVGRSMKFPLLLWWFGVRLSRTTPSCRIRTCVKNPSWLIYVLIWSIDCCNFVSSNDDKWTV